MSRTFLSALVFLLPAVTWAMPITFDLRDISETDDDVASISLSESGLMATLSANTGVINRTSRIAGINSSCSSDKPGELDLACENEPPERVTVSFNQTVNILSFNVSRLSGDDRGIFVSDASDYSLGFTRSGNYSPTILALPLAIVVGQTFYIQAVQGNGFSFNHFTVEAIAGNSDVVAISEPNSLPLILVGVGLLFLYRNRYSLILRPMSYFVGFVVRSVNNRFTLG